MKGNLAFRAVVPVAVAVTGFTVISCLLLYQGVKRDMMEDTIRHERSLAGAIVRSARYTMMKGDRETLGNIIANVGSHSEIEHVRIFNNSGTVMFSSRKSEIMKPVDRGHEGCADCHDLRTSANPVPMHHPRIFTNGDGRRILAITAPILNDAGCSSAACHVHPVDQKLLGTLDIGFSQEPLMKSLSILQGRMIVFSLMMCLLAVAGTAALLRRSLLLPVRRLADYASAIRAGRKPVTPPMGSGELGEITTVLRDLADRSATDHGERR